MGTYTLLAVARHYVAQLPGESRDAFRFHHISTNEVCGDLVGADALFTEALFISQAHRILHRRHRVITWCGLGIEHMGFQS